VLKNNFASKPHDQIVWQSVSCAEMSTSLRSVCSSCLSSRYRIFIVAALCNEVLIGVDEALYSTDCCHGVMTDGKLEYCVTQRLLGATEENHKIIVRGAVRTRD
jgi:hypothetical protein